MNLLYSFITLPCFRAILPLPIDYNIPNIFILVCSCWLHVSFFVTDNAYGVLGAWFISTIWSAWTWARHDREAS